MKKFEGLELSEADTRLCEAALVAGLRYVVVITNIVIAVYSVSERAQGHSVDARGYDLIVERFL